MITTAWMWGGVAAVAASGYLLAGVQTVRLARSEAAHVADVAKVTQAQQEAVNEAQMRANQAALRYEEWKAAQRPKIIRITKEVDRVLQTHASWSDLPIPDSVRDAIQAVGTSDATFKPDTAVPTLGP